MVQELADESCAGRLVLAHEGGYSEVYVPFCAHRVIETLALSEITAPDPFAEVFARRQPDAGFNAYVSNIIGNMVTARGL
jgi:acetoin utilization deacetylase AcuC-like enzyme